MILFNQTTGNDAQNAFVPGARFDNDWAVHEATIFDFMSGRNLFSFTFFVQLFEFVGERGSGDLVASA